MGLNSWARRAKVYQLGSATAPRVSVVIPTFNSAWSIGQTLASVVLQTFSDIEVIVVDDGSTDDLETIVAPFVNEDGRVRIVRQSNQGLAGARNRGLAEAKGKYIAFIDADDLWHPAFLEACHAALVDRPDAPFAYAFSHRIDSSGHVIPSLAWPHEPRHDLIGLIEVNSVANGSASLFRRALVVGCGGFDPTLRGRDAQGAEDWKLVLQLAELGKPALVPRELVAYRVTDRSMSRSSPETQLRGIIEVLRETAARHPEIPKRHFLNARTVMNGWMLDAFIAKRMYGRALSLLLQSYALNPWWLFSRDVRAIHRRKIWSILADRKERKPLADIVEGGERPFSFLRAGRF